MTQHLQDPDLPARFPMELAAARDENGEALALVRCNDGSLWLDTGNATVPWRRLPAIPEPTAEEVEAAVRAKQQEEEEAERKRQAALEEGMRQHEALQEAVRANQERLREERREAERVELEARQRESAKEVERLAPIRPHWSFW